MPIALPIRLRAASSIGGTKGSLFLGPPSWDCSRSRCLQLQEGPRPAYASGAGGTVQRASVRSHRTHTPRADIASGAMLAGHWGQLTAQPSTFPVPWSPGCWTESWEAAPPPTHLAREVVEDVAAVSVEDGDGLRKVVPLQREVCRGGVSATGLVSPCTATRWDLPCAVPSPPWLMPGSRCYKAGLQGRAGAGSGHPDVPDVLAKGQGRKVPCSRARAGKRCGRRRGDGRVLPP